MTTISIVVDFWQPQYHGLLAPDNDPEWPPSPFRLAEALMAGCHQPDDDLVAVSALRALTCLRNPVIYSPKFAVARLPATYAPRSGTGPTGRDLAAGALKKLLDLSMCGLASTNRTLKPVSGVHLAGNRVVYEVADPAATVDLTALDRAARRVPYLGRSHDGCDITVHSGVVDTDGLIRLGPVAQSQGRTRGWTTRCCDWMDAHFAAGEAGVDHPNSTAEPYLTRLRYDRTAQVGHGPDARALRIVATDRVIGSPRIPSFFARNVTRALANFHDVRTFPCVTAGARHSDGGMRAVGLTGSDNAAIDDAATALVAAPGFTAIMDFATRTTDPAYWGKAAARWVSATPLRAFPDVRVVDEIIGKEVTDVTGATPKITWSREPVAIWQQRWRQPPDGLGLWWAEITFDRPVTGPLQFGRDTALGFGLFVPLEEAR